MKKNIIGLGLIIGLVLGLTLLMTNPAPIDPKATEPYHTPTLFVHGYGGGYGSEKNMIADLSQESDFRQVLRYDIASNGKLTVTGHWQPQVKQPLIAIVFKTGKPNDKGLSLVLNHLKNHYQLKAFNAVGHSAGANAWVNWAVNSEKDERPDLQRLITIVGPFNGFNGLTKNYNQQQIELDQDGKPQVMYEMYQAINDKKRNFPETASVLNLYGNIGDDTDGTVPVDSARALNYLVKGRAKAYIEKEIRNKKAQHSQLHNHNTLVSHYLHNFLKDEPI